MNTINKEIRAGLEDAERQFVSFEPLGQNQKLLKDIFTAITDLAIIANSLDARITKLEEEQTQNEHKQTNA